MSLLAIQADRLAVELGVRPVRAELPGPAQLQRQVPGADDRHPLVRRPRLHQLADGPPQCTNRYGCGSGGAKMFVYTGTIGRSACGRSVMIGQVTLWSIRSSLLNARSKP